MKIVQVNATYGKGSTGSLAKDIHLELKARGYESYVFWATACNEIGDKNIQRIGNVIDHKIHALLRRLDIGQGFHSKLATKRFCERLGAIKPDVVHLHNLHSNYIHLPTLYRYLQKNNIPTILTLHDCWFFTGYCTHPRLFHCLEWKSGCKNCPAVKVFAKKKVERNFESKTEIIQCANLAINGVSKWTELDACESFLAHVQIKTHIYNWVDLAQYQPRLTKTEIYDKYKIDKNKKLLLGVAQGWSMTDSKGGAAFCGIADALKEKAEIILVGENNGIEQRDGLKCIGYTSNKQELIDLYAAADIFVNPSRFETFGLVTIEAMACGTPVVAYDNTGSSELVIEECGRLVTDGNVEELISTLSNFLEEDLGIYKEKCISYVKKNFDKTTQVNKYAELYKKVRTMDNN